ncbi:hypothetical protein FACS1894133_7200 [Clostridia bacterium]|nr:hypothetical protein FACS1894133_7200 [Clostridia bacterium]
MVIQNASASLYNVTLCVYGVSYEDFYNLNVKDIFKVSLSNVTDPNMYLNLGLPVLEPHRVAGTANDHFANLKGLIHYYFAARIPFLKRNAPQDHRVATTLKDGQLKEMYKYAESGGAVNYNNVIADDFKTMYRDYKGKYPEPVIVTDWFRRFVYSGGGELALVNNRNLFLFGCFETMFPLYYSAMVEALLSVLA